MEDVKKKKLDPETLKRPCQDLGGSTDFDGPIRQLHVFLMVSGQDETTGPSFFFMALTFPTHAQEL